MADLHAESNERCERVHDESTPVASVVVTFVGIGMLL